MPTARIAIEQTHEGWIAEIEAGGVMARCRTVRANRFGAIIRAVTEAYHEMAGSAPAQAPLAAPVPAPAILCEAPLPARIRFTPARRVRGEGAA
jgi:hypothetical protein